MKPPGNLPRKGAFGRRFRHRPKARDRGFAYLMALFMVLAVIVASQVAAQNIATAGRREREDDMIWRGNQYERAIRLYYRKVGRYPQNLEDLQKGLPELHFLRFAAVKDPMNAPDGEWGFIYVNATGQLIGSSRYASLQQMVLMDMNGGKLPTVGIQGATPATSLTAPGQNASSSTFGSSTFGGAATGAAGSSSPVTPTAGLFSTTAATAVQKPTGPVDGPVLGAFLTGVVSKSSRASVKVYKGGKKYSEWEFIWNPLEDQARAVQQGLSPQGAIPGQPTSGLGGLFGFGGGQAGGPGVGQGGAVGANPPAANPPANNNPGAPAPPQIDAP